jgi:hypothetical protein
MKIKVIKDTDNIKIEMSGFFYKRLQSTLFYLLGTVEEAQQLQVLNNVKENKISSKLEHEVQTILSLITEIENQAEKQNVISEMTEEELKESIEKQDNSIQE